MEVLFKDVENKQDLRSFMKVAANVALREDNELDAITACEAVLELAPRKVRQLWDKMAERFRNTIYLDVMEGNMNQAIPSGEFSKWTPKLRARYRNRRAKK